jgi:cellulose synthase/poly-beta-1,6-N-acetylglucosamine synthase-like glycosyltransferase
MHTVFDKLEIAFWIFMVLSVYSYLVYPVLLAVLPAGKRGTAARPAPVGKVTVIIAARNEAAGIEKKIRNTLALHVPGIAMQIIVASDASDDGTDQIVESFAGDGVILARSPQRLGKESAQQKAIESSDGDIIIFTDAGTTIEREALERLLECFASAEVGAVSSVDRIVSDDGKVQGEGLYVRYEMLLRRLEGRFNTLVGLSGSFFAARREVCRNWDTRVPSDFGTALNCAVLGLRAVSDDRVVGYYKNLSDPTREFGRKLRTALRGMVGLVHRREVLNPLAFGWFSFQVFSHKVMRWGVPWFLTAAALLAWVLAAGSAFHLCVAVAMTLFFLLPVLSRPLPMLRRLPLVGVATFFVEVNVALLVASIRVMRGQTMVSWEPSKR